MTRYVPTGRPLSLREREVLTILAEEANEVAQNAMKLLRFGFEHKPDRPHNNSDALALEIGDLGHMQEHLIRLGIVRPDKIIEGVNRKRDRLRAYLLSAPHDGAEAFAGKWLPEDNPFPGERMEERKEWFQRYHEAAGKER